MSNTFLNTLSLEFESILLDTLFVNGLDAIYFTREYAVLSEGFIILVCLPVANFTGLFKITFPATSDLLILVIPLPVNIAATACQTGEENGMVLKFY